jgi:putative N6-adenine-specific DNA methylase
MHLLNQKKRMKALAITHKGITDITQIELKEILSVDSEAQGNSIIFDAGFLDLCRFCYSGRSIRKVLLLIHFFPCKNISDIEEGLNACKKSEWLSKDKTFAVRCWHETTMDTLKIERTIGGYLHETFSSPVDLKNPQVPIFAFIDQGTCFLGVDIAGFDLSKRSYFIFSHPSSLKGTIAYALCRLSGFSKEKPLLDVFSKSGNITIEATLFAMSMSCHYYNKDKFHFTRLPCVDQKEIEAMFDEEDNKITSDIAPVTGYDNLLRNVKAAQKNAKIAGINKEINFTKGDIEWIDTKFKEEEIECVIAYPQQPSHRVPQKPIEKIMKELFYQLDYILKSKGKVVIMTHFAKDFFKKLAEDNKFKLISEHDINQGRELFTALILHKA